MQLFGFGRPSDQIPSLHCHYGSFIITTDLSVPVQCNGTFGPTRSPLVPLACHHYDRFPKFEGDYQTPQRAQIKITPP